MKLALLQGVAYAVAVLYLSWTQARVRRQNRQTWKSLLARLRQDWSARELADLCFHDRAMKESPAEKWRRIRDAHGLWAMFQNAGVMLEMANYAARNTDQMDREVLAQLRTDATLVRWYTLSAIAAYAFGIVQDGVCMQALRAESIFLEMELHLAEVLQQCGPAIGGNFSTAS